MHTSRMVYRGFKTHPCGYIGRVCFMATKAAMKLVWCAIGGLRLDVHAIVGGSLSLSLGADRVYIYI